jgi:hypothetical protein
LSARLLVLRLHAGAGLRFRFRSPEHVLAELVDLHRTTVCARRVPRPIFTDEKDRIHAICEGIVREKLDCRGSARPRSRRSTGR